IEVKEAKEEQLEESILVTGKIVPENEQKIYYDPENGEIIEYIVKENTTVKEGDPLFEYDPTHLDNELKNAQRELDVINNQIKSEENQIALMNQQIDQMKKDQKNYENEQAKLVEQEKRYVAEFQKYEKAMAEYNALVQQVDEEEEEGEKEVELPPMPVPP